MNWRAWWARLNARERRLIGAAGVVLALLLLRFLIVSPFLSYREGLQDEIVSHREMLQNDQAYLARATDITKQLQMLRARYAEIRGQLTPGDTPTLAAASLQDTLHTLATDKGITIQSTQVMREETIGDFRRIAVRITVTGELRELAEFLTAVEYGQRRLSISFLEISRRGAVLRGQSARALAATIEVNAFLQEAETAGGKVEPAAAKGAEEGAGAAPEPSGSGAASPGAAGTAAPPPNAGGTPPAAAGGEPAVPPQAHGVGCMAAALEGHA